MYDEKSDPCILANAILEPCYEIMILNASAKKEKKKLNKKLKVMLKMERD